MHVDDGYADRVVRDALVAASGGLDPERVAQVVAKVVEAIDKQSEALKNASYKPEDYERIARAMDWLRGLTDEQLRIVQGWIEANGHAAETPMRDDGSEEPRDARGRRRTP